MTINEHHLGRYGEFTSGPLTLRGTLVYLDSEGNARVSHREPTGDPVSDARITYATLRADEWDFRPDLAFTTQGWYSEDKYPVGKGFGPVYIDADGETWRFFYTVSGLTARKDTTPLRMDEISPLW